MKTALVLTVAGVLAAVVAWRFIVPGIWGRSKPTNALVPQLFGPLLLLEVALIVWLLLRR
jgi:hypothetical protein